MPALETLRSTLQSTLDDALGDHGVPGGVVGVRRGDDTLIVASGVGNVSTGVDVTPDTLFQLGSISKTYTATLMMQLVHAGLIDLDEPVRAVLQEFRVRDDAATLTITPRHLLSHTSGLQGDHFLDCGRNPDALWRYVSTLEDVGQLHAPEELFSYCNSGYGVLGRLVEESTGDHFTKALQRRLIRPLGIQRTVTLAEQAIVHRVAVGHHHRHGTAAVMPWALSRFNVPLGGIISDAEGVLEFAALQLRDGKNTEGKQVLPARAVTEMREGQIEVPGTDDQWGLGWHLLQWGEIPVAAHDGNTLGQRAFLRVLPDSDTSIVVLTNSPLGTHIADEAFGVVGAELLNVTPPSLPQPAEDPAQLLDVDACTGIYERMHQRLAIAPGDDGTLRMTIIPDELFSLAGMRERTLTLRPVDRRRFVTTDPDTGTDALVVMVDDDEDHDRPDDEGPEVDEGGESAAGAAAMKPAYVHFELQAHARIA